MLTDIYDLVILDIMLPKRDGLSILKEARGKNITTPVILLTAKGEISDKVTGLDCGADDYLAKPFYTEELLARIRALTRRKTEGIIKDNNLCFGDVMLDVGNLQLKCKDKEVTLTAKESGLLELLINRNGSAIAKDDIISRIWGFESDVEHNSVEVYVSFLRRKLTFLKSDVSIKAIRNVGYILEYKEGV